VAGAAVYQGGVVCGGFQGQYVVHGGCQNWEDDQGDTECESAVWDPAARFVMPMVVLLAQHGERQMRHVAAVRV
jgi:hypothetical protein